MKKVRLKKKNCLIALLILIFMIIEIINPSRIIAINKLQNKGYSKEAAKKIIHQGLKSKTLEMDFNDFINKNIFDQNFKVENFDIYGKLNYSESIDISLVNELIQKEYNPQEIGLILERGNADEIKAFLKEEKISDINNYLEIAYAKLKNINRYLQYRKVNGTNYVETVTYVNIGLDKEFYEDYQEINDFSLTMLVNKYRKLSSDLIPPSLVSFPKEYCEGTCPQDNEEVVKAFKLLADDIEKDGLFIYVTSAYRSFNEQEEIYNKYTKLYGANYDVAKAGFSEHQTGLTVDIGVKNGSFKGSKEEKWMKENAYKYGFIFRYDSRKEKITGYNEPWHFRYVGKEIAKDFYEKNLTFDEYYIRYLDK